MKPSVVVRNKYGEVVVVWADSENALCLATEWASSRPGYSVAEEPFPLSGIPLKKEPNYDKLCEDLSIKISRGLGLF